MEVPEHYGIIRVALVEGEDRFFIRRFKEVDGKYRELTMIAMSVRKNRDLVVELSYLWDIRSNRPKMWEFFMSVARINRLRTKLPPFPSDPISARLHQSVHSSLALTEARRHRVGIKALSRFVTA